MRLPSFRRRPLAALQIEVTSRCTRRCAVCPRGAGLSWREGDLDPGTWRRLREDLDLAPYVHLQGWGEPLLHPRLPEMVAEVKAAGLEVGLTTNGDPLPEAVDWIVESGVDLVTVSVAGDGGGHAALRDGSRLPEVWDAVRRLLTRRGRRRGPRVQISYLLTLGGAAGLRPVIETAADLGVDEVFVTHLDVTPTQAILEQSAFDESGLRAGVGRSLESAERAARSRGLTFRGPTTTPQDLLVCALDPLRFVFVGWDGRVGPCVNLLPPIDGAIPRWTSSGVRQVRPLVIGRLADASLREILRGEARRLLTRPFAARRAAEDQFLRAASNLTGGGAMSRLEDADRERESAMAENPFPSSCSGCHKAQGW